MIDGSRGFGNGRLLPAGPLRAPLRRLRRVDWLVRNGGTPLPGEQPMTIVARGLRALRSGRAENLGIRMNTIPLEDSMYLLFFLLLTITFYERALKREHGDQ